MNSPTTTNPLFDGEDPTQTWDDPTAGNGSSPIRVVGSSDAPAQTNPVLDDLFGSGQAGLVKAAVGRTKMARKNSDVSQHEDDREAAMEAAMAASTA